MKLHQIKKLDMKAPYRFVLYADPPAPIYPSITKLKGKPSIVSPKDWSKYATKRVLKAKIWNQVGDDDFGNGNDIPNVGKILASSFNSRGGLLIVAELPLEEIVRKDWYSFKLQIESASLCACLRHDVMENKRFFHLTNANIFGFITQKEGGCNPKAYNYFPNAPKFNEKIEEAIENRCAFENIKRYQSFQKRPLITESLIKYHFPQIQFNNSILDKIAKHIVID